MSENEQTRMELVEAFIPHSPHAAALGISIEQIETDRAVLAMPFKPELVTIGDVVHGGAISTPIDTAATVAAWAIDEVPEAPSGATVALSVNFISAARAVDLRAEAKIVKRGRKLSFCQIEARDPERNLVANGIATYSF
ncbi:MAG: PaaI family thioesterase [Solirubrobacterales bacterium]